MKPRARLCALSILASLMAASGALADTTATSKITQIKIVAPGDKSYQLFHGAVWLDYDKATHNYRWGGAHCGNDSLNESQVSMLFAAFRSRYSITLDYKNHFHNKNAYRCVTGFTISRQ